MKNRNIVLFILSALLLSAAAFAQNPIIMDQFTADPTARVFNGRVYVYPSHDVNCGTDWFCMKDYHVFSSENLVDWIDHGMIVSQDNVPWVDAGKNSLWAPDCYEKNGKYYFYFPATTKGGDGPGGMTVGVAISDTPYGPFKPAPRPIKGVSGIDPNVFIDKDGQAYLYWASVGQGLVGAKLKANMLELDGEPQTIGEVPEGMKEGPFLFERNGIYYFTFPHVIKKTEALCYGMGDNPLGPFKYKGIIMDEHPSECWTNHHSIIEYKGQWYLFYHHNDLSPDFDKNRSIRADKLFFNEDGTIQKVTPTPRGVGIVPATNKIQIEGYSAISEKGAAVEFLDIKTTFAGWKVSLKQNGAWVRFCDVDFGAGNLKTLKVRALSKTGSAIKLRVISKDAISEIEIGVPAGADWQVVTADVSGLPVGIQNIEVASRNSGPVDIDWVQFE